jgi:hypothetical protein
MLASSGKLVALVAEPQSPWKGPVIPQGFFELSVGDQLAVMRTKHAPSTPSPLLLPVKLPKRGPLRQALPQPSKRNLVAFASAFGLSWESALANGVVYSAVDACRKLGLDYGGLYARWRALRKDVDRIRFGGNGLFCAAMVDPASAPAERVKIYVIANQSELTRVATGVVAGSGVGGGSGDSAFFRSGGRLLDTDELQRTGSPSPFSTPRGTADSVAGSPCGAEEGAEKLTPASMWQNNAPPLSPPLPPAPPLAAEDDAAADADADRGADTGERRGEGRDDAAALALLRQEDGRSRSPPVIPAPEPGKKAGLWGSFQPYMGARQIIGGPFPSSKPHSPTETAGVYRN